MPKQKFIYQDFLRLFSSLVVLLLLVSATIPTFSQDTKSQQRVTIKGKELSLKQVFQEIKKQTGLTVFYTSLILNDKDQVSLNFNNAPLTDVLNFLFKLRNISYEIRRDRVIVLEKKAAPPEKRAATDTVTIRGVISDEKGLVLPGVSIKEMGSTTGASTNDKGAYALRVSGAKAKLIFTFVGFESQEIDLNGRKSLNVTLKEKLTGLDEVVVIGYGTTTRRDLTGSIGTANIQDMEKAPVRSFEEALTGRIAGVQVNTSDGQPGAESVIVIRGNNSVTQDNSPLYVIDGFPIENPDNNAVNPSDIESIEVLKDASATAIYGARGANGVVMITTKRGKIGDPVITYNGYYGVQKVTKRMDLMNAYDFVQLQREANNATSNLIYGPASGDSIYLNKPGIDWQSEVYQSAPMLNNYLSVTGGTAKTKYAISGSVLGQDGIILNTGFNRYQGRIVLDQTVSKKLKIGVNVNYTSSDSYGILASNSFGDLSSLSLISSIWAYRPVTGVGMNDDDLIDQLLDPDVMSTSDYRINPVMTAKNTYNKFRRNSLAANAYAEYMITPSLKLRINGGVNKAQSRRDVFYSSQTYQGSLLTASSRGGPYGSASINEIDNFLNENILTYNKTFNKVHSLNLVGGFTFQKSANNLFGASAIKIPNEELGIYGLDEGTPSSIQSALTENKLASFLSRATYNYKSKYYVTASFRTDGSSRFAPKHQWSYFPSTSLAWRFSKEKFMEQLKFVNDAKLRVGYGVTGNNRVSDYASLAMQSMPPSAAYGFNNSISPGSALSTLSNKNLKWESTSQYNAGLDLVLLKDKIQITTDVYSKNTFDLLLNSSLPGSVGMSNTFKNIGEVQNKGLEISVSSANIKNKDFSWTSSINIAFNRNKVIALTENQEALTTAVSWDSGFRMPLFIAKIGQPIAQFYGYVWEGVYQKSDFNYLPDGTPSLKDDVPTNGGTRSTIRPGDVKYKDLNGDGIVNSNDYTVIGNPYPLHTGGFTNNFTYKQFDLSVFLQWSYGNDVFNANRLYFEGSSVSRTHQNQFASYVDRWSETNQDSKNFRVNGQGPFAYSTRVVEDGSYLRLKTVSFGYNLPVAYAKAIQIKSARIFASAQNIYTWTKYSGPDPEVSTRNSALTTGFDYSPYPRAFTLTLGVNATF